MASSTRKSDKRGMLDDWGAYVERRDPKIRMPQPMLNKIAFPIKSPSFPMIMTVEVSVRMKLNSTHMTPREKSDRGEAELSVQSAV